MDSSPEILPHRIAKWAFWVGAAIVALQVLDVLTSQMLASAGGSEINPLMSLLMRSFGPAWWIPKVLLASFAAGYFATRERVGWPAGIVLMLCCAIVLNNISQLLFG